MKAFAVLAAVLVLSGCATTSGLNATSSHSGFDNARVVDIQPHGNACASMTCTGLGAQWSSARPDTAIVTVQVFNSITGIAGAALNIDGAIVPLTPSPGLTNFSAPGDMLKVSLKTFNVPLATVRQVAGGSRVWLRVSTPSGTLEDAVIEPGKDSKAFHALRRFLAEVDKG